MFLTVAHVSHKHGVRPKYLALPFLEGDEQTGHPDPRSSCSNVYSHVLRAHLQHGKHHDEIVRYLPLVEGHIEPLRSPSRGLPETFDTSLRVKRVSLNLFR